MFNTYGNSQNKAGRCELKVYNIRDAVSIPDGVHLGSEGFIVVKNGKFIAEVAKLYDYYGENPLDTDQAEVLLNTKH